MPTLMLHIMNEDPIVGEVDELPAVNDTLIYIKHPRRRDGKEVHYIDPTVTTVMFPLIRLSFVEVMPSGEDEDIIGFVRE